MIDTVFGS